MDWFCTEAIDCNCLSALILAVGGKQGLLCLCKVEGR